MRTLPTARPLLRSSLPFSLLVALALTVQARGAKASDPSDFFGLQVIDQETGRGIPLVELETVNHVRFVTDSQGWIAVGDPDLLNRKVFFTVRSHGYEYPKDGFGFHGKAIWTTFGARDSISLTRRNLAERLYRVTGSGIDVHAACVGQPQRIDQPLAAAGVFGCDSVMTSEYQGRLYWFWGDTLGSGYPLGVNFHITGATTPLASSPDVKPDRGLNFSYLTDQEGRVRKLAEMPGDGPTWISSVCVLPDVSGRQRMYANYVKIRNLLESYRWGFVVWDDEKQVFDHIKSTDEKPAMLPDGQSHPFLHKDQRGEHLYFGNPLSLTRVAPNGPAFVDPSQYEGFTCLKPGTLPKDGQVDRDEHGRIRYEWRANTPALSRADEDSLIRAGVMKEQESRFRLLDIETGEPVVTHNGSLYWNEFRKRWVLIVTQHAGASSLLGEIWYAEADHPTGPWGYARKIVTHDRMTFYNPKHHPFFDEEGGKRIYFEGTYTQTFSGSTDFTPRYEYNQVMYRLDLTRPELALPVGFSFSTKGEAPIRSPAGHRADFYAYDLQVLDTVPIVWDGGRFKTGSGSERVGQGEKVIFFARQTAAEKGQAPVLPLSVSTDGVVSLRRDGAAVETQQLSQGESSRPLFYVWSSPGDAPSTRRK